MNPTDKDIQSRIMDILAWDVRLDPAEILVEVKDGSVTLSGIVVNYAERSAALDAAWSIGGVREVANHISVRHPQEPGTTPADGEIQDRIVNLITWNPGLDEKEIRVRVLDGVVSLEGSVDAHWKRGCAEELAAKVLGVADIRNELAVVPTKSLADRDLARAVIAALQRNPVIDACQIEVTADGGVITLGGKVSTRSQRASAMEAASRTHGVTEVRDHLSFVMIA